MNVQQKKAMTLLIAVGMLFAGVRSAPASSLQHQNLHELISLSDLIIVGEVVNVEDGIENNVPFTEITLDVTESIRGGKREHLTFRQFGLRSPRRMPDGRTNLNVTPEGWPRFAIGERILLFLYKPAKWTGLRTTVGLSQGKFNITQGFALNGFNNAGLFVDVSWPTEKLDSEERDLLAVDRGPIDASTFISLVRKVVEHGWSK